MGTARDIFHPTEKRADRNPPSLEVRFSSRSEEQLQRKLNLPRRTEIAGRETRALNLTKCRVCYSQNRVTEVRVVENVEHFGPELQVKLLGDFRILGDREIRVQEIRSRNRISAEAPRMA